MHPTLAHVLLNGLVLLVQVILFYLSTINLFSFSFPKNKQTNKNKTKQNKKQKKKNSTYLHFRMSKWRKLQCTQHLFMCFWMARINLYSYVFLFSLFFFVTFSPIKQQQQKKKKRTSLHPIMCEWKLHGTQYLYL